MNTLTPSNRLTPPPAENRLAPVRQIVWAAWIIMLLVSTLPNIIFTELFKQATPWLFWAKLGLLAVLIGVSCFWHVLTPLRKYLWVLSRTPTMPRVQFDAIRERALRRGYPVDRLLISPNGVSSD